MNLDELKNELSAQENAETIIEQLSQTYQLLQQDEAGVLTILNETKARLSKITGYSENYEQLSERIQSLYFELKDIADSCENELEKVQMNPEALAELNTRLNLVNTLLIKHQVQTVEELVSIRDEYAKEQNLAENLEEHIKEQLQYIEQQKSKLKKIAAELTKNRKSGAKIFVEKKSAYFTAPWLRKSQNGSRSK